MPFDTAISRGTVCVIDNPDMPDVVLAFANFPWVLASGAQASGLGLIA